MRAAQHENGWVPEVIPSLTAYNPGGAAWSDAVTIIPWQLYQTYGDISFVSDMYEAMEKWIAYIPTVSKTPNLWTGCWTYGDWLALDAPPDYKPATIELSKRGYSNDDLVCSAFYANSVDIVIRAGKLLGRDVKAYEELHNQIVSAFRKTFGGLAEHTDRKSTGASFQPGRVPRESCCRTGLPDPRMRNEAADRSARNPVSPARTDPVRICRDRMVTASSQRIPGLAVFRVQRCDHRVGTLGRHQTGRNLLGR